MTNWLELGVRTTPILMLIPEIGPKESLWMGSTRLRLVGSRLFSLTADAEGLSMAGWAGPAVTAAVTAGVTAAEVITLAALTEDVAEQTRMLDELARNADAGMEEPRLAEQMKDLMADFADAEKSAKEVGKAARAAAVCMTRIG